jgi:hypothetical protein
MKCLQEFNDLVEREKRCRQIVEETTNLLLKMLKLEELESIINLLDLFKRSSNA